MHYTSFPESRLVYEKQKCVFRMQNKTNELIIRGFIRANHESSLRESEAFPFSVTEEISLKVLKMRNV